MRDSGRGPHWSPVVNVSSGIVANPGGMVGANAYRPGAVDTAMQEWIRSQDEATIPHLRERFHRNHREGLLVTPAASAPAVLVCGTRVACGSAGTSSARAAE
ncbi:hypothetical protein LWP59_22905 [Amycolatopsis acidiphila]|uniref:Uncharacterized protein n=1 Tax=Amycolatopsis acidiphila TaxID=715473 RepID=A0A558A893_9PSEU|nr:hypothetical protein [Amycolatopsis acidiphila]TVT20482.1 hypothetical protein FNH06_20280 [Amycolatopsis acidiphila]UIJ57007.1 hypothetical protein LWP59_22905 [Amycolatopsis acidiphila]GHG53864.1 hypothetical protein GCM10017788_02970 [Amycolatopsis acidiphila]